MPLKMIENLQREGILSKTDAWGKWKNIKSFLRNVPAQIIQTDLNGIIQEVNKDFWFH